MVKKFREKRCQLQKSLRASMAMTAQSYAMTASAMFTHLVGYNANDSVPLQPGEPITPPQSETERLAAELESSGVDVTQVLKALKKQVEQPSTHTKKERDLKF